MQSILVETSARHVHSSQETVDLLFGKDYKLTYIKELSQKGQYACEEKVTLVGPKKSLEARILGPVRQRNQIEVSITDLLALGLKAPIRESGDLDDSSIITLKGPKGEIKTNGLIVAKRHIHMNPLEAKQFKVNNGDKVMVRVNSDERSLIFDDVIIRVNDAFSLAMHIDTDEANAAGLVQSAKGELLCK